MHRSQGVSCERRKHWNRLLIYFRRKAVLWHNDSKTGDGVFLRILLLIGLSLQLTGTFFLATQVVPRTWPERLRKDLQGKHEELLKARIAKAERLENLRKELSVQSFVITVFKILTPIALLTEPVDTREYWRESEKAYTGAYTIAKKLSKGMANTVAVIRSIERVILRIDGNLLRVFHLFLTVLLGATLYLTYGFGVLRKSAEKTIYFLIGVTTGVFSYFCKRQGQETFAILGFCLLAVGFVFQAMVSWLAMK